MSKIRAAIAAGLLLSAGSILPAVAAPPPSVSNTQATVRIENKSGVAQKNYPVQIGLPLSCGQIARFPQAKPNGVPVTTQATVTRRCPDGSAKFATLSFLVPELPVTGMVTVTFGDQATGNEGGPTKEELLARFPNFETVLE